MSDQYHEPSGSSKGGQFATAPSSGNQKMNDAIRTKALSKRGAGTSDRDMFDFLNERLKAGHLKPGERTMLEARIEELAKKILGVKSNAK